MKKIKKSSYISMIIVAAIFCCSPFTSSLLTLPTASANGIEEVSLTIVQPADGGFTKMASPLMVTTNVAATCYYRVDEDFVLAFVEEPQLMRTDEEGTLHTANMEDLTPGSHTVYVHCYDRATEDVKSATWTKVAPGNTKLLGVDGSGANPGVLYEIDSETGDIIAEIGAVGDYYVTGLAQDPISGILYATTGNRYPGEIDTSRSLLTINPDTGEGTLIGKVSEEGVDAEFAPAFFKAAVFDDGFIYHNLADIAFDSSGQLYGWSEQNDDLYKVDKSTGLATRVGDSVLDTRGDGLSFNTYDELYLLPDGHSAGGSLVLINTSTGAPEEGYPIATRYFENFCAFGAASFDSSDMLFAQANDCAEEGPTWGSLMVVDINTGIIVDLGYADVRMAVDDTPDMTLMNAIAFYTPIIPTYNVPEPDIIPPGPLTNINIVADAAGTVTITWTDPTDPDLSRIIIDETSQGITTTSLVDKGIQTLILNDRVKEQEYTYTFRAEDTSGNLSEKQIYTITIPAQGQEEITPPAPPAPPAELILHDPEPAPPLPPEIVIGSLVKKADSNSIYFIDQDNRAHAFPDANTYFSWFPNFDNVQTIPAETLAAIPVGNNVTMRPGTWLIKIQTDPKVYAVEPYGVICWVNTELVATDLYGADWNTKIVDVDPLIFSNYQVGADINSASHSAGSVIQYAGSSDNYYIENGLKRLIEPAVFTNDLFQARFVLKNIAEAISYALGANFPEMPIETLMTIR
jgi:hypothetical protein